MGSANSKAVKAKLQLQEQKIAEAQSKIQAHEKKIASETEEKSRANREIDALKKQLVEVDDQWNSKEQERSKELARLREELALRTEEVDGQRRTALSLRQERDGARDRLEKLIKEKRALEQERLNIAEEAKRLQSGLDQISDKHMEELNALRTESEQYRQGADTTKETNAQLAEKLAMAEEAARNATAKHTLTGEELTKIKTSLAESQARTDDVNSRLNTLQTQLDETHGQLSDKNTKLARLQDQLADSEARRTVLDQELSSSKDGATDVEKQLGSQRQQLAELRTELLTARKQLERSEAQREKAQLERNHGVTQKSSMHEAFEALKMELRDSHEQWRKVNEENTRLKSEAAKSQQAVSELEKVSKNFAGNLGSAPNFLTSSA